MRLIDADALLERMKRTNRYFNVKFDIEEAPTIEAEPVRHGQWVKAKLKKDYWGFDSDGDFGCWSDYPVLCSSCKYDATENSTGETNFCPNCGAKMDGDSHEA